MERAKELNEDRRYLRHLEFGSSFFSLRVKREGRKEFSSLWFGFVVRGRRGVGW